MRKERKYRFDILSVYLVTIGVVLYGIADLRIDWLAGAVLVLCILFESLLLWEPKSEKRSNGIYPALALCLLIVGLSVLEGRFAVVLFRINTLVPVVLLLAGMVIRLHAFRALKGAFSYSLTVHDDQRLMTSGIYSLLRHPAYFGTLFYITGISCAFNILPGYIALVFYVPITVRRIKHEEQMLIARFGHAYTNYQKSTRKLLPFIW